MLLYGGFRFQTPLASDAGRRAACQPKASLLRLLSVAPSVAHSVVFFLYLLRPLLSVRSKEVAAAFPSVAGSVRKKPSRSPRGPRQRRALDRLGPVL
jgi:hypothetical protein